MVGGEIRAAAAYYGKFEFWPGPLDSNGQPTSGDNCSEYDRIWVVSRVDILDYEETGRATADLAEWPAQLGAPVLAQLHNGIDDDADGLLDEGTDGIDNDGDGAVDELDEQELRSDGRYDLDAGDRPFLIGDEAAWWIMNDVGNVHETTNTTPIGLEVRGHAFAFHAEGHLGNATFYKYDLSKKGAEPLEDAFVSMWSDPDLGDASDDLVGVDTTLGLGYVYNFRPSDLTYGTPPALGFDFLRGPLSDSGDTLRPSSFMMFISGGPAGTEWPYLGAEIYNAQHGRWRGGEPITARGWGFQTDGDTTTFMYAGDPATRSFWSEMNADGEGNASQPGDRRMLLSAGPFSIEPGETQEVVVGILWARGTDHLDSVRELREASREIQEFVDRGYTPRPALHVPSAPDLLAPADGASAQPSELTLRWGGLSRAVEHELQLAMAPDWEDAQTYRTHEWSRALSLDSEATYFWRVRASNAAGYGPWSPASQFTTSAVELRSSGPLRLASGEPAFVEVRGPNGGDPCADDAESRDGCEEIGANAIYGSVNSTGDYYAYHPHGSGSYLEADIARHAPHTFEIRFTEDGSYGVSFTGSTNISRLPFEVWDIGPVAPDEADDPSDDVQLIAISNGSCTLPYGPEPTDPLEYGWPGTARIHADIPNSSYEEWAAFADEKLGGDACQVEVDHIPLSYLDYDFAIRNLVIYGNPEGPNYRSEGPPQGVALRFYSRPGTPPVLSAPLNGADELDQPISFWWNAFDGANAFHFQLDTEASFSNPLIDADSLQEPTYAAYGLEEASYLWRVRAQNVGGRGWTDWSEPWSFSAASVVATEDGAELPTSAVLSSNYPNPFNPTTTIHYGLPRAGDIRIEVFDLLGRRVAVLLDRSMAAGWHRLEWNAADMSTGAYFIRLTAGGDSDVRKVVLLR